MWTCITDLRPGTSLPLCRAGIPVACSSALWTLATTILAVNWAICTVMKGLNAPYNTNLIARTPTAFCTVFPVVSYPAMRDTLKLLLMWRRKDTFHFFPRFTKWPFLLFYVLNECCITAHILLLTLITSCCFEVCLSPLMKFHPVGSV